MERDGYRRRTMTMNSPTGVRSVCPVAVFLTLLFLAQSVPAQKAPSLPDFPRPVKTFRTTPAPVQSKPYAGDGTRQDQTPARLTSFGFSADGSLLFLFGQSGGFEVRDMQTGGPVSQFSAARLPAVSVITNSITGDWVLVGADGVLRFVDPRSGNVFRTVDTGTGRSGHRIRKVLVAADESWVAYANGQDGKVLDLWSGLWNPNPKVLADLGDAEDISLSPDGSALWAVNRDSLFGFAIPDWKRTGTAKLPEPLSPNSSPVLAVVNGARGAAAFVAVRSGILRYSPGALSGRKISKQPAKAIYSAGPGGPVLARGSMRIRVYGGDGTRQCQWQMASTQNYSRCAISRNGQWLGCLASGKVDVWGVKALLRSCSEGQ